MTFPLNTTTRVAARALTLATLFGTLAGCATGHYQGLEPSARTFHEDANARDYYVGMDLNFSVDQDSPHLAAAHRFDPDVR